MAKDYIYQVTIVRTYDGFLLEKSVVNDGRAKIFPEIEFEESEPELDHAGDIDYIGKVFVIFSTRSGNRKEIVNKEVIEKIKKEIERLKINK